MKQLKERIDTEGTEPVEKQAIVYVGGEAFSGEVRGGKTFITSRYYAYLDRFFDCEENCKYKPEEPIIDEETGLQRFYNDEVYNRSVESLARMAGYLDLVSSWEQTEDCRIVVVNNAAKNGPYQLVRRGREVNIRLYTRMRRKGKTFGLVLKKKLQGKIIGIIHFMSCL